MQNMDEWFIGKDSYEHQQRALEWRYCKSDAERKQFIKTNRVR